MPRQVADPLALLLLALAAIPLLLIVAAAPPGQRFAPDRLPAGGVAQGFYGVERNAAGPYRWAKPDAALILPLAAPGPYRVTLTLQDLPDLPEPRTATLYVAGTPVAAPLAPAARDYTAEVAIPPATWAARPGPTLTIELHAPAASAPGDPRALGPLLTAVAIEPTGPRPPDPALLGPALFLLALAYAAARLAGASPRLAGLAPALPLVALAALAALDRPRALWLAYQPLARPGLLPGVLLALAPFPLLAVARRRGDSDSDADTALFWCRASWPVAPVVALALGARLVALDRLSLWLDEGYTVAFARLPWRTLLGLGRPYDVHPPLYYALVKLATGIVPETLAGRLVSALAGTATVAVVYACAARLLDRRAALVAALALAGSPYHLWYSREGRMYALAAALVALAYLALLVAAADPRPRALVAYGLAVALALYADTSAAYALAPQAFLWLWVARRRPRRAAALAAAAGVAIAAFAPWLARDLALLGPATRVQASYLAVSAERVGLLAANAAGLGGRDTPYWGTPDTPWSRWPAARPLLVAIVLSAAALGLGRAAGRAPRAAVAVAGLTAGTYGVAILVSLATPGFDDRTLLPVACGWALLLGAAVARGGPRALRGAGAVAVAAALALGLATGGQALAGAQKQDYRALAAAAARESVTGPPLLASDDATAALLAAYQPGAFAAPPATITADTAARRLATPAAPATFALAYGDYPWLQLADLRAALATLGYARVAGQDFPGDLHLDRYARPGAPAP